MLAVHIRHEVGLATFNQCFKFAFIRNPWDKAISQYHYMATREDLREYIGMLPNDSFKKYLELIQKKIHVQWEQQYKFIFDENGKVIIDFLGRFESFHRDVNYVLARLGIKKRTIPHRMKTVHRPYQEYYDNEAIEIVQSIYSKDITAFGYTFQDNNLPDIT